MNCELKEKTTKLKLDVLKYNVVQIQFYPKHFDFNKKRNLFSFTEQYLKDPIKTKQNICE